MLGGLQPGFQQHALQALGLPHGMSPGLQAPYPSQGHIPQGWPLQMSGLQQHACQPLVASMASPMVGMSSRMVGMASSLLAHQPQTPVEGNSFEVARARMLKIRTSLGQVSRPRGLKVRAIAVKGLDSLGSSSRNQEAGVAGQNAAAGNMLLKIVKGEVEPQEAQKALAGAVQGATILSMLKDSTDPPACNGSGKSVECDSAEHQGAPEPQASAKVIAPPQAITHSRDPGRQQNPRDQAYGRSGGKGFGSSWSAGSTWDSSWNSGGAGGGWETSSSKGWECGGWKPLSSEQRPKPGGRSGAQSPADAHSTQSPTKAEIRKAAQAAREQEKRQKDDVVATSNQGDKGRRNRQAATKLK